MDRENGTIFSVIITSILLLVYSYFGYFYTYYGLGIFLVPIVLIISAIAAFTLVFFKGEWKKYLWLLLSTIASALFSILLISMAVDNYKPSYYIHLPENFEGMVHLLPSKKTTENLFIGDSGIGYYNTGCEANVKIMQGENDISNALNQYGSSSLIFKLADSLHYSAIEITCFEVVKDHVYSSSQWNQPHATCMNEQVFIELLKSGKIDSSKVMQHTYPLNPN
jgi:hypothetical protein